MTISRIVFRFDLVVDSDGTEETFYATTHGFTTKPTDSPANTYIEESVAEAGSYRRDLFSAARVAGGSAPSFGIIKLENVDGRLDDFARYASAGGTVRCYYGDDSMSFPGGYWLVYVSRISAVVADFDKVTIRQKDRAELLRAPVVTATFAGSGGLEGPSGGPGRKKQIVIGFPGLIPLIPVDTTKQIYYIQANAIDTPVWAGTAAFSTVYEGGIPITRGDNYTTADDLWNNEPDVGEYRLWSGYGGTALGVADQDEADANNFTRGPIFVRLKAPPQADLRFGGRGYLQNTDTERPHVWRFTDLCNRAGMNDVTPTTLAAVGGAAENFDAGNRLIEGDQTFEDVFNDRALSLNGAWGFNERDQFFCVTLADPTAGTGSSVYTFNTDNATDFARTPIAGMERPVWQVNVKAGRAFPAAPLEAASAELHDLLTREQYLVQFTGSAADIKTAYPQAVSVSIEIDGNEFETQPQRTAFIDAFGALYGTQRDFVSLKCARFDTGTLAITLHDKVTLQIPRFGYDAGVLFRVVAIEVNLDEPSIRFVLWGNNSGFAAWSLGGGAFPAGAGDPGGSWGGNGPPNGTPTIEDLTSTFEDFDIAFFVAPTTEAAASFEFEDFTISTDSTITTVETDPYFSSVALLMHFDGANNSTTATDSSSYADTKTLTSPYVISTAQSQWGGASLLVPDGTSETAAASWSEISRYGRGSGQGYTVEAWFRKSASTTSGGLLRIFGGSSVIWQLRATSTSNQWEVVTRDVNVSTFTVTSGAWHFIQTVVATDGTSITKVDGTTVQTTSSLSTWTTAKPVIDAGLDVAGGTLHVDDWRITPGVARTFAVPTAAFPNS